MKTLVWRLTYKGRRRPRRLQGQGGHGYYRVSPLTGSRARYYQASPDGGTFVITALDLDAKDRERLNSGVQSVLVKQTFRPADLVERIRRLADTRGMVSPS